MSTNSMFSKSAGLMVGAVILANTSFARDYSACLTPTASADKTMWYTATMWSDGRLPHSDACYTTSRDYLRTPDKDTGTFVDQDGVTRDYRRFYGQVMYLRHGMTTAAKANTENTAWVFENDGLVFDDGGYVRTYRNAWIDGKVSLETTDPEKLTPIEVNASDMSVGVHLLGQLSGARDTGFFVCMQNVSSLENCTMEVDVRGNADEFFGTIATENGGAVRASSDLKNARVILGFVPSKNTSRWGQLKDFSLGLNGDFTAAPVAGTSVAVSNLVSNGGTVRIASETTLVVEDLSLNGGCIRFEGANGSISVRKALAMSEKPVRVYLAQTDAELVVRQEIVRVPLSAGVVNVQDFEVRTSSGNIPPVLCETQGGDQILYVPGYVLKTKSDGSNTSFLTNNLWSDGLQQHADAHYLVSGGQYSAMQTVNYGLKGDYEFQDGTTSDVEVFRGESLTIGSYGLFILNGECNLTFRNRGLTFLPGGTMRSWVNATLNGALTIGDGQVIWEESPMSHETLTLNSSLSGSAASEVMLQYQSACKEDSQRSAAVITYALNGDVTGYLGCINVETNHILDARQGLPNGRVTIGMTGFPYDGPGDPASGSNGTLRCSTESASVSFGAITNNGGRLELASGASWQVGSLTLNKGLIRLGAVPQDGGAMLSVRDEFKLTASPVRLVFDVRPGSRHDPYLVLDAPLTSDFDVSDFSATCSQRPGKVVSLKVRETDSRRQLWASMRSGLFVVVR